MKISDVVYKSVEEVNEMPRFDLKELPKRAKWYLQLLAWVLSFPETFAVKSKIKRHNMDGLKGPYILLCNHNSFVDFKVATRAIFPRRANYIVAVDGYINREGLLRNVGGILTRKFISDRVIVRQIKHSLEVNKVICEIYPEARYSLVGTTAMLPDSLGKLCKMMGYPVVSLISNGHHLRQPYWNLNKRKVQTKSNITQILNQEDIQSKSIDEINEIIRESFIYDDYKYQYDNKISITFEDRAKGLHKALYQCPSCKKEFKMTSNKNKIWCEHCGKKYTMSEYGRLEAEEGTTEFPHIPDWFEWQRSEVKKQILTNNYNVSIDVHIDSLPNATGFYRLGTGKLKHDKFGYHLIHEDGESVLSVKKPVLANYGVHVEFDYFGKGDCISFSTFDDTFYLFPVNQEYAVTKFHFATEELFKIESANKKVQDK